MRNKLLFTTLSLFSMLIAPTSKAQTIERPGAQGKSSFAVVIDSLSRTRCRAQIDQYKATLEGEGLPTFILSANWKSPEQIRELLKKLYDSDQLEGAVFIGEIPIPMITKAQHLTTAFKMDERKNVLLNASVPSDRFYEDFDLEFIALPDSTQGLHYFFEMSPTSPQYIECELYSGRIKPQKSNGDPYKQIADYLEKAVREHKRQNPLDQFISYTGHGSYSNSLVAWRSEQMLMREQFGDVFSHTNNSKYLRYSMEDYMKDDLIRELRRDDLDFMVFHEHGSFDRQYLSGDVQTLDTNSHIESVKSYLRSLVRRYEGEPDPWKAARKFTQQHGLDTTWYANAFDPEVILQDSLTERRTGMVFDDIDAMKPNARLVLLDACYNGDFREDDFIAGKYIFAGGNCISVFANSVNVLQDKSAFDLLGLLGCGTRLGNWAKHINILESHIFGDPTFRFTPTPGSPDVNGMEQNKDLGFWLKTADDSHPDMQNLALIHLFKNGYSEISDLLWTKFDSSPYAVVRYNALTLLERLRDDNFKKALKKGTTDSFEFIRRISVHRMGRWGDEEFLPYLVDAYINDYNSARMTFNVSFALACFDSKAAQAVIRDKFMNNKRYNAERQQYELLKIVGCKTEEPASGKYMSLGGTARFGDSESALKTIVDKNGGKWRKLYIMSLKNVPFHQITDQLLQVLCDETDDTQTRILMAESLAWFNLSIHRDKILAACHKLLDEGKCSPELTKELTRTCRRIESTK